MFTLCFTTTPYVLSRLIRRISGSPASHVVISTDISNVPVIMQADVGGVQFQPRASFFAKGHTLVAEYQILVPVSFEAAVKELGESYDYAGLFGFVWVMLGRWLKKKWRNPWASPKALVCSEFVLALNANGSIPEWIGLDSESTTPADLLAICEKSASFAKR